MSPLAERQDSAPPLGSEEKVDEDLTKLLDWLQKVENSTPETEYRKTSMEDYNFYSGKQDTDDVLKELEGLKRPATIYNEVKPKVDMLIGMAAQTKHNATVVPVGVEDEPMVELMAGTLDHFQRKEKIVRKELECFEHTVKGGRSLLFFYIDTSNPFKPVIKAKRYDGRNFYRDPDAQEYDMSDDRFLFLDKWLTEHQIKQFWKEFDTSMAQQYSKGPDMPKFFDEAQEKYRIVEGWYYKFIDVIYFVNPMSGKVEFLVPAEYEKFEKVMRDGLNTENGRFQTSEQIPHQESFKKQYHYMIFSGEHKCMGGPSPYNWEGFPAVFYGAYKDYDTNSWFGAITVMKDGQRTLNVNRRQLVYLLQTLPKGILMHEIGSVINIEEYEEKSSQPNFHLEIAKGQFEKVKFQEQPRISPVYHLLDGMLVQTIKNSSGAQDNLMGIQTTSREPGITVRARQQTGMAVLYILYDNLRESRLQRGKLHMSLIQQYVTEEMAIRIKGPEGARLMQINSVMNPENKGFNDITAGEFDYEVEETAETMSIRAATAQMLVEFSQNNPNTIPPDVILEYTDLPYSAKQRVKEHWQAMQDAEKANADREYDLRLKEIAAKSKPKT